MLMRSSADSLKKSVDALNNDALWEKKKIKKKDEETGEEIEVEDYDWDAITKADRGVSIPASFIWEFMLQSLYCIL